MPGRQMCARGEIAERDTEVAFSAPMSVVFSLRAAIHRFRGPEGHMADGLERLIEHVRARPWQGSGRPPLGARPAPWR